MDGMTAELAPNSLAEFWMPFTANRQFKAAPRLLVAAKDMHYTSHDGRQILDGAAGLWCVNAGHCRPRIAEAIARQAATMDFAPMFQMGHPQAFELAARICRMLPDGLDHAFFSNSGSEAVDTALKIALAYHRVRGEGQRTRLIGRERGYHGVGFGGISVGGIGNNRKQFGPMLPGVDHLPHTHDLARNAFSRGQPAHGAELADALERILALHDPSTVAAVIVEPMAGSTGVLIPPVGYLQRLREICTKHGILLIFDEVISGFGRLGAPFAVDLFGVTPDILTLAKGITNATVPMGATVVSSAIYDAFMSGPPRRHRVLPRLHLFRARACLRRRTGHSGHLRGGRDFRPCGRDEPLFRGCGAQPQRPAARDRRAQFGHGLRRGTGVPPGCHGHARLRCVRGVLPGRAAGAGDGRYHRAVSAADRGTRACR